MRKAISVVVLCLLVLVVVSPAAAFSPRQGDQFTYHEVATTGNGTGAYKGYTDQTVTDGSESVTGVSGSTVFAHFAYNYVFSDNQAANTTTVSRSGFYTFDSADFFYLNATDDQSYCLGTQHYAHATVWFAMNNSLTVGDRFSLLSTVFTVTSRNAIYVDPATGQDIRVISAQGSGTYSCNDAYGTYTAPYTWDVYFDPASGYIVGYHYVEQDNGTYQGQAMSFTYTDDLYVKSTSYPLTAVPGQGTATTIQATPTGSTTTYPATHPQSDLTHYYYGAGALVIILIAILVYAGTRRKQGDDPHMPRHSEPPQPSSSAPPTIDIEPRSQPPVQQVVIRDVAKVQCQYCGTLVASTDEVCPHCGGKPR